MVIFQGQVDLSANILRKKRMNRKMGLMIISAGLLILALAFSVVFWWFPQEPKDLKFLFEMALWYSRYNSNHRIPQAFLHL